MLIARDIASLSIFAAFITQNARMSHSTFSRLPPCKHTARASPNFPTPLLHGKYVKRPFCPFIHFLLIFEIVQMKREKAFCKAGIV